MAWAPDYCTAAELKSFVRIDDAADDVQVALAITAASRAIDHKCNRQFGVVAAPEARYYTAHWDRDRRRWVITVDDFQTEVGLLIAYDSDDSGAFGSNITLYTPSPRNSIAQGRCWTSLIVRGDSPVQPCSREDAVRVTATWGWASVPGTIKQACLMQASRLLARRDSPYGVAGSPEAGTEIRLLPKLDPDVALAIRPYYRWWGAA